MNSISKSLIFVAQDQIRGNPIKMRLDEVVHCRYG